MGFWVLYIKFVVKNIEENNFCPNYIIVSVIQILSRLVLITFTDIYGLLFWSLLMHRFNAFHNQLGNPNSNIYTNIIRLENDFYDVFRSI